MLPTFDPVMGLLDTGLAVPQNWLVDGTGKWLWAQLGFNPAATDWEDEMLKRLEGLKK